MVLWASGWRDGARRELLEAPGAAGESRAPWLPGKGSLALGPRHKDSIGSCLGV
jgi:hypothetical protein